MIPELRENTNTVIFDIGNVLIYFAWKEYLESLRFSEETNKHVADLCFVIKTGMQRFRFGNNRRMAATFYRK